MTYLFVYFGVEDESEAQTSDFSSWKLEQTAAARQRTGQYISSPIWFMLHNHISLSPQHNVVPARSSTKIDIN